ncbi:invasion associated locus B family protein [Acidimangrovimonas sediminis]|uniref:invasion associated locus B family protein n=1 Tax=Acidimangrovimonas sediminis TaxID=2056283 RepID=UPI0013048A3D|nr:invasion associated locus B family protein [Acidimangrovimonas sediminis]
MTARIHGAALAAAVAATLAMGAMPAAAQQGNALPGGANALNETHGDWNVACRVTTKDDKQVKSCAMSQQQVNKQKQRALEISLVAQQDGSAKGVIVLPFGLAVTKPVSLDLDDAALGKPMAFSTCVPVGCLVPLDLDAGMVKKIGKGKKLTISATSTSGQDIKLDMPLGGFTSAFDRVAELLK